MAAPAGSPMRSFGVPVLSVGAVIGMCWLLRVVFGLAETKLDHALPAASGKDARFTLADGSGFPGRGKIEIGGEQIEVLRITPDGMPVNSGARTIEHPDSFKVVERGANGTTVKDHAAGALVRPVATLFFPENNATFGDRVDDLFYLILWITGVAFILTEAFLFYCVLSFWAKPGQRADYVHGNHRLEVAWTIVPAVILVVLAIFQSGMWSEMKQRFPDPSSPDTVNVQVTAKQFEWNFRYAGQDGKFGTIDDAISTGEMRVPVGKKIRLELRSMDTIHSYFLPNFRVKQDVVPGMAIPSWFEAKNRGVFQIMCAELCGNQHTNMGATLIVSSQEDYDAWVKARSEEWASENDGMDRAEWFGAQAKTWWWWDRNPTTTGFTGENVSR